MPYSAWELSSVASARLHCTCSAPTHRAGAMGASTSAFLVGGQKVYNCSVRTGIRTA